MRVYRYEDKEGVGPYQKVRLRDRDTPAGDLTIALREAHQNSARHPGWKEEGIKYREAEVLPDTGDSPIIAGCRTPKALRDWFRGFEEDLEACGYQVGVYEVPDQHVQLGTSGRQVAFHRGLATRISWAGVDIRNIAL